jgi:hypothetical protein
MPEILNLLAPLLLESINRENVLKRVEKKFLKEQLCAGKKTVLKGWCSKLGQLLRQS